MAIAIRPCGASIQQSRPDDSTAQSDFSVSVQAFEYVDSFLNRTLMDDIIASWKLSDAQVHVANSLYGEYVAKVVAIEQTARERFATMKVESRQERLERFKREYAAAAAISREELIRLEDEMRTEGELFQATHREQWKAIHCDAERQSRSELTRFAAELSSAFDGFAEQSDLINGWALVRSYFTEHATRRDVDYRIGVSLFDLLNDAAAEGQELWWLEAEHGHGLDWLFAIGAEHDDRLSPKARASRVRVREILAEYVRSQSRAVTAATIESCQSIRTPPQSISSDDPRFEGVMKERAEQWDAFHSPFETAANRIAELAAEQWNQQASESWHARVQQAMCPNLCASRWPDDFVVRFDEADDVAPEQREAIDALLAQ